MSPVVYKPKSSPSESMLANTLSDKEDVFSLPQAFRDWLSLLVSPNAFFETENGAAGLAAPMSLVAAYVLTFYALWCLVALAFSGGSGVSVAGLPMLFMLAARSVFSMLAVLLISALVVAAVLHGVSRFCGGSGEFSGTLRAVIYSYAPIMASSMFMGLYIMRFAPSALQRSPQQDPILTVYSFASFVWLTALQTRGLAATQNMTASKAAIAVIVTYLILTIGLVGLLFAGALGRF